MFVTLRPSYYDASVEKKVFICNTKSLSNTYMVRGNYKLSRLVEIGKKTTYVGFYLFCPHAVRIYHWLSKVGHVAL